MKTFIKGLILTGWSLGALMLGMCLFIIGSKILPEHFSESVFIGIIALFGLCWIICTPILAILMFQETMWVDQKEIDDLKNDLWDEKQAYIKAINKLARAAQKLEEE